MRQTNSTLPRNEATTFTGVVLTAGLVQHKAVVPTHEKLPAATGRQRFHPPGFMLLLLLALILPIWFPGSARAACNFTKGSTTTPVNFNPPSTITVPFTAPVGSVLYTSPLVSPSNPPDMNCNGTTDFGMIDSVGATPGTGINIYPTGISGLSYSITHGDLSTYLYPYPCCQIAQGKYTFNVGSSLQLIKTGPIVSGSTLPAGVLGYWQYANGQDVENFTLANAVTIIDPACTLDTPTITVPLPSIAATSLTGTGSVADATAFAIGLTCSSGATLYIQLDTAAPIAGTTGVIANSGSAVGVGVQLIDKNFAAVAFGVPTLVGATPNGALSIPYYAQYYQTATTIAAGTVSATATFTLSYQ